MIVEIRKKCDEDDSNSRELDEYRWRKLRNLPTHMLSLKFMVSRPRMKIRAFVLVLSVLDASADGASIYFSNRPYTT